MELTLDFESHAGRPLPPTPLAQFKGAELSLQEKGQVLRLAVTLLGRMLRKESILPAPITTRCRSLVPLGAGTVVGVKGRPLSTRPMAVWHRLRRMQQYSIQHGTARWALQQQAQVSRRKRKAGQMQSSSGGTTRALPGERRSEAQHRSVRDGLLCRAGAAPRCQARTTVPSGGAVKLSPNGSGASPFHPAGQVPLGQAPRSSATIAAAVDMRHTHTQRQCAACAAVGRGVRHCCARGHPGHPRRG